MIEPISSFAISCAAGIALNIWSKSQQTVDKEVKKAFEQALKDWCPNSDIREYRKEELKKNFLKIAYKPESFSEDYKCYGEYEKFYIFFDKQLVQFQVAYNYISSIQDSERYKTEINILSEVRLTVSDTNEKVTEILDLVKTKKNKIELNKEKKKIIKQPVRKVLFNNYTRDVEEFYFERKIDEHFRNSLESGNLWIYGFSGIGKTALINRNLIHDSIEYVYCDFSPIDISSSQDVLNEIILTIIEKYNINSEYTSDNLIKKTCDLLSKIETKEMVIVIDELSINDSSMLKEITEQLVKLLNHHCNKSKCSCLRFIASTISEPTFDKAFVGKAMEYFEIIEIENWNGDLEKLLAMLENSLCIGIDEEMQSIILKNSKSSPRLLKKILRKLNSLDTISPSIVQEISEKARKEHF